MRFSFLSGALLGTSLLTLSATAHATTFTVKNLADSGDGSLRELIGKANASAGADTINFASNVRGTLTLTSGELAISSDMTLEGPGASSLTLSGGNTQRLFNIQSGQVTLKNLTLSNGSSVGTAGGTSYGGGEKGGSAGGGAILNGGKLTLSGVTLSNNSALGGAGGAGYSTRNPWGNGTGNPSGGNGGEARGGAVLNKGTLTLIQTRFTGNKAVGGNGGDGKISSDATSVRFGRGGTGGSAYGGAIYNGGVITSGSASSPSGSTFTSNQAAGGQGGKNSYGDNSTAGPGGAYGDDLRDVMPIAASLTVSGAQSYALSAQLIGTGDVPLTYAIVAGTLPEGLQLDAATGIISGTPSTTAKGVIVTYAVSDGYRTSKPARITFNIRALESPSLIVTTTKDVVNNIDDMTSLREAIAYASSLSAPGAITFGSGLKGTIVLSNGALVISHKLKIAGPQDRSIVLDGNKTDRVIFIEQGGSLDLSNLYITRGSESGLLNQGTLTMTACTVAYNTANGDGGGLYSDGQVTLKNCTFARNTGNAGDGGGIFNLGTLLIDSCTIAGNSAVDGGGIENQSQLTINNTIVAGNTAIYDGNDIYSFATGGNYNLVQDPTNADLRGSHNLVGVNPKFGSFANHGGPTPTLTLLSGSPAIDSGKTGLKTDQRGAARGATADIGAYEVTDDLTAPVPTITSPTSRQSIPLTSFSAIQGSASDNVGVTLVRLKLFRVRGGNTEYWNGSAFTTTVAQFNAVVASAGAQNTTWSYAVPSSLKTALDAGQYFVYAYGRDAAGNQSTAVGRSFTLTTSGALTSSAPLF